MLGFKVIGFSGRNIVKEDTHRRCVIVIKLPAFGGSNEDEQKDDSQQQAASDQQKDDAHNRTLNSNIWTVSCVDATQSGW